MPDNWRDIAARKQQQRADRIPKAWLLSRSYHAGIGGDNVLQMPRECGILSKNQIHLTEDFDATALVSELASGKLKSIDVVTAFCKRAAIVCTDEQDPTLESETYADHFTAPYGRRSSSRIV